MSCHGTLSRHQVVRGGQQDVTHPYRVASFDRSSHEASPIEFRSCSQCSQLSCWIDSKWECVLQR
ncbi:hypothetical protein T02_6850 [Trichinella nativa]|uniref:Uncharacterized protein n=1 Tax=Trichinella nativa TaxID=6335 RepID=A0A0V1KWS9_9BILA|nr:hypothetical protein T02_6850 [Trichinella nativa]